MDRRMVFVGVGVVAVLLGGMVVVLLTPDPEPIDRSASAPEAVIEAPERLSTRVVTPETRRPERPEGLTLDLPSAETIPADERVETLVPIPATYQGVRSLFQDNGKVVQKCLERVEAPPAGEGSLPSRVTVQLTVQGGEGTPSGLGGIEVMGDYDRAFTGFTTCLADRFAGVRFQPPANGMVTTLTWQQAVPKRR